MRLQIIVIIGEIDLDQDRRSWDSILTRVVVEKCFNGALVEPERIQLLSHGSSVDPAGQRHADCFKERRLAGIVIAYENVHAGCGPDIEAREATIAVDNNPSYHVQDSRIFSMEIKYRG